MVENKKPICPYCGEDMIPCYIELEDNYYMFCFVCNCETIRDLEENYTPNGTELKELVLGEEV